MSFDISNLSIIDLISEKHANLRKLAEKRWNSQSEIHFSQSEWYLISKVAQKSMSISQAASMLNISRQAMQKTVQKLELKGYITTSFRGENKRDKFLFLTKDGQECCDRNNQLKHELESELVRTLGASEVENLKKLLIENWLVE